MELSLDSQLISKVSGARLESLQIMTKNFKEFSGK